MRKFDIGTDECAGTDRSANLKRALLILAVLALTGVTLYASVGFFLAPRLVERKLEAIVEDKTGLTLAIEAAQVNPFTLTLSLDNVTLLGPESTPAVSIDGLHARVQPASIAQRAWLLRDVVIRGLDVADPRHQESVLTAPTVDVPGLAFGNAPATMSFDTARLNNPRLRLRRAPDGGLSLPYELTALLPDPAKAGVRLSVSDGTMEFSDQYPSTPVRATIVSVNGTITRRRADRGITTAIALKGRVSGSGTVETSAEWVASRPREGTHIQLSAHDIDLTTVSSYVSAIIGHRVLSGRLDLTTELELDRAELDLDNRIVVRDLQLGERVGDLEAAEIPVRFAAALLEDNKRQIALRLPVSRRAEARTDPAEAFAEELVNYVTTLAGAPFDYLAMLVGHPNLELGRIEFSPGAADVADDSRARLAALDQALVIRPKIGYVVYPGFDPATDRDALARQQIRLHVNLATSEITPTQAAGKPIDVDDARVRSVLDEFGENRLPPAQWAAIAGRFNDRDTVRYRAVLAALIENEEVSRSALERLARFRARSVVNAILQSGHDPGRIRQADTIVVDGGPVSRLDVDTPRNDED